MICSNSRLPGLLVAIGTMLVITPCTGYAADFFFDGAVNPQLRRDYRVVSAGTEQTESSISRDGQEVSIAYQQFGAAADLWNNEHNQILAGIQYEQRELGRAVSLPDGFAVPQQLETVSASLHFKHVTFGDWSLSQSIQYTQGSTDDAAITARDTVDLIGLAAYSPEPAVTWVFGYAYFEKYSRKSRTLPVIEYAYAKASNKWVLVAGIPFLSFAYFPHPDWQTGIGPGIAVAYKISPLNILRLSYSQNGWAYRLAGSNVESVDYSAKRVALDWSYLYSLNHHSAMQFAAFYGWEYDRKLGAHERLSLGDSSVFGMQARLLF